MSPIMGLPPVNTEQNHPDELDKSDNQQWPEGYAMCADGLYAEVSALEHSGPDAESADSEKLLYLCPSFEVLGYNARDDGSARGVVLKFTDIDGKQQRIIVYLSDLAAGPQRMLRLLLDRGFMPSTERKAATLLQNFFLKIRPSARCHVVKQNGWFDDQTFVMPGRAIGKHAEQIICDSSSASSGLSMPEAQNSLDQWQQRVGVLCKGNSRLLFALSLSFAAPLIPLTGVGPGIFHLRGSTSSGKTSLLHAVASVQSSPQRIYSWNVSGAGLEAAALEHNHMLMLMDEFAEIPARKAQALVYQITNGHGALRARSDGSMREDTSWQTMVLSAGEIGLEQHCETLGVRLAAGQKVRMLDIEAEVSDGYGIFEDLHGCISGAQFSRALVDGAATSYASALPAFLEELCAEDKMALRTAYHAEEETFIARFLNPDAPGSLVRVAQRFFLAGFSGELATRYGVSGWDEGEAMHAAELMLQSWLHGSYSMQEQHRHTIIEQVYNFLAQHDRRFYSLDEHKPQNASTQNLPSHHAGYKVEVPTGRRYFVKAKVMTHEVLKGLECKQALDVLMQNRILEPNKKNESPYMSKRLPDSNSHPQRYYVVNLESVRGAEARGAAALVG